MWLQEKISSVIVLLMLGAIPAIVSAQIPDSKCSVESNELGARYTVTRRSVSSDAELETHVEIWRRPRQVALVYEATDTTDVWDLVSDGRQKLIRYFDHHERAIEYQPEDIPTGSGTSAWNARIQFIPDAMLESLTFAESTGTGCDRIHRYEGTIDGVAHQLAWRPGLRLIESLETRTDSGAETWRLDDLIVDRAEIDGQFETRSRYQTTDFVDIGDNESDPFLRQVIRLGFVDQQHVH